MNTPIRRLSVVVMAMFAALLIASTMIQFVQADELNNKPGNRRTLLATYAKERGSILVDGNAVAMSKPSNDQYEWQRTYTDGELYAPATGYFSFTYGTSGVERGYNDLLSGNSDKLFYRQLPDVLTGKSPQGASVDLTIQAKVQQAASKALGNQRGAVIAIDPKTGAILAMVTSPSYDPNLLAGHNLTTVQSNWKKLQNDPKHPLTNRAIGGDLYPPGSTFKLVTTAAALESGSYSANSMIAGPAALRLPQTTHDLPNDDHQACGPGNQTTLQHALEISCNTAYAQLGMDLGQDKLAAQAKKFGFGDVFRIPMRATPSSFPSDMNTPQTAMSAIGQYDVRVTPLQVAMISAAIANGGTEMQPYLVKNVVDSDLDVISSTDPKVLAKPVSQQTAGSLVDMMTSVVTNGTGKLAAIAGTQVAGKTGTAQGDTSQAASLWFTGFAPAKDPKIALAIVLENGGGAGVESLAGQVAAPAAKPIFEAALNR